MMRPERAARPDRSLVERPFRDRCPRCRRPADFCYCAHLTPQPTRTRLVFLQHPREARMPVGTARMAHLALPNSELHTGISFAEHARVRELTSDPSLGAALLFPADDARDVRDLGSDAPRALVVVDGTWSQARTIIRDNPVLQRLPRVAFTPDRPGNYRIRKEPAPHCLATIEAVVHVLGVLEGDPARFESMLRAFEFMVDRQLECRSARTGPSRHKRRREGAPPWRLDLVQALPRLVLVHGEANAHPREAPVPGLPEIVHLAAERAADGARFEAVMEPRRPLAISTPHHLDLPAATLLEGEPVDSAMKRFLAFLRPDDVLGGWGPFTRELLSREGVPTANFLDLRLLAAARLHRRPGAATDAAIALASPRVRPCWAPGRSGRALKALGDVLDGLLPEPAPEEAGIE